MHFVDLFPPVDIQQLRAKQVKVVRKRGYENRKTVIFDLDETLVHCSEDIINCDIVLPVSLPTRETIEVGINVRPFAIDCLKAANKKFEVFVFTASHKCYADVVLDYLDPKKELIQHRFYRDSCIELGKALIKDLRIFDRKLKDVIMIDNSVYAFGYQLDNGIPIIS